MNPFGTWCEAAIEARLRGCLAVAPGGSNPEAGTRPTSAPTGYLTISIGVPSGSCLVNLVTAEFRIRIQPALTS